jgi:hypothetical protein
MGDPVQNPRDDAPPDHQHQTTKAATLASVSPRMPQSESTPTSADSAAPSPHRRRVAAEHAREGREQHEGEHHREIFHDEPADRDPPALGLDEALLLQRAQHHHRARDREREPEHEPGAERPAEEVGEAGAERRHEGDLAERARHRDRRTDMRSVSEKCRPTPNMSRMTPSSASCGASAWSAT